MTFLLGFVLISVPFFTAQYFQDVQHLSALQAGLRILAFSLHVLLRRPRRLAERPVRIPVPATLGGLISGTGPLLLTGLGVDDAYADVFWKLMLVGIGFRLDARRFPPRPSTRWPGSGPGWPPAWPTPPARPGP